jgi:hypothetical protein
MNRVPGSDPTEKAAAAGNFVPSEVEATAFMADRFGTPLECAAIVASLDHEFVPFGSFPIFFVESAPLCARSGETIGQIIFFIFRHEESLLQAVEKAIFNACSLSIVSPTGGDVVGKKPL